MNEENEEAPGGFEEISFRLHVTHVRERLDDLATAVGRAVVDDDDLQVVRESLTENRADRVADIALEIVASDNDGRGRHAFHANEGIMGAVLAK